MENTYLFTFKTAKEKNDFKSAMSKAGKSMQKAVREALKKTYPKNIKD